MYTRFLDLYYHVMVTGKSSMSIVYQLNLSKAAWIDVGQLNNVIFLG